MNIDTHPTIVALLSIISVVVVAPVTVLGAGSTSFTLYDDVSDVVDASPLGSTSYSLDESGETWIAYPFTGTNYQIVTAPPTTQSSSSSTTSSTAEDTEEEDRGSHRGSRTNENNQPTPKPSAPEKKPEVPSLPRVPAQIVNQPPEADPLPDVPIYKAPESAVERMTRIHFFDSVEEEKLVRECEYPQVFPAARPASSYLVSALMLLIAFVLGYVCGFYRSDYTKEPGTSTPSKKKK
jgi:hypothetical protein